jgi:hypothetical protein
MPRRTHRTHLSQHMRRPASEARRAAHRQFRHNHDRRIHFERLEDRIFLASDFGDAPAPYPTLLSNNGPRHEAIGPQLGTTRDAELNGQPTANAAGDDEAADPSGGIAFDNVRAGSQNAIARVYVENAPAGARIDAWVDFNRDGRWSDNGERVFAQAAVQDGWNELTFAVPTYAIPGQSLARIRLSTAGGLGLVGDALDGEVEDVTVNLLPPEATPGRFTLGGEIGSIPYMSADIADLDGDGDLDVAASFSNFSQSRRIEWIENVDGDFTVKPPTIIDPDAAGFSLGDLDNDGDSDVVTVGGSVPQRSRIWLNDGAGVFTQIWVGPGDTPYALWNATQLYDLDQDGDLDILASPNYGFAYLENQGAGQFIPVSGQNATQTADTRLPVDLDRDGDVDIVPIGKAYWMENIGNYNFAQRTFPTIGDGAFVARLVVDLDHDGFADVVGNTSSKSKLAWWRNNQNRTFTPRYTNFDLQWNTPPHLAGEGLTAGDVDGDGYVDLVNAHYSTQRAQNGVIWYKNDGAGNLTLRTMVAGLDDKALRSVHLADLDSDGDLDLYGPTVVPDDLIVLPSLMSWYENVSTAVDIAVTPPAADEPSNDVLIYTFRRADSVLHPLTVNFQVSGTASFASDYTVAGAAMISATAGIIEFPVGVDTVYVLVTPTNDVAIESNETVIFSIAAGHDYVAEGAGQAVGTIIDSAPSDFGDAPAPYPTALAKNGARHTAIGPQLGTLRDQEANGLPNFAAAGDDQHGTSDEDGVQFGLIRPGQANASVVVHVTNAPAGAYLDAWIDFNGDGNWGGTLESIASRLLVQNGDNSINFHVPGSTKPGSAFARFRLSTSGGLSPSGAATDGEVEDYVVPISNPTPTNGLAFSVHSISASGARQAVPADVDRDGDFDVVAILLYSDRLVWFENDGHGGFTERFLDTLSAYGAFAVTDLDADGDPDIAAVFGTSLIRKYENDGAGAFLARTLSSGQFSSIQSIATADMDGDADFDLIVGGNPDPSSQLNWLENKGAAGFAPHYITDGLQYVESIEIADLDGDGDLDLVSSSRWSDEIAWHENDGMNQFTAHRLTVRHYTDFVQVADLDGDGDLDILGAGEHHWAYVNDGAGHFSKRDFDYVSATGLAVADLDGDGDLDWSMSVSWSNSSFTLRRHTGNFRLDWYQAFLNGDAGSISAAADFDGDGSIDLLVRNTLAWYRNLDLLPGDFNRDHVVDAADYSLWRDTLGSTVASFTGADANGDGLVSQTDYELWLGHFGMTSTSTANVGAGAIATLVDATTSSDNQHKNPVESSPSSDIPDVASQVRPISNAAKTYFSFDTLRLRSQSKASSPRRQAGSGLLEMRPASFASSTGGTVRDQAILAWLAQRAKLSTRIDAHISVSYAGWESPGPSVESQGIAWSEFDSRESAGRLSLTWATC